MLTERPDTSPRPISRSERDASPRVVCRTFEDCDELAELVRADADIEYSQLSGGRFEGTTRRLELGDLRVHLTRTGGETVSRAFGFGPNLCVNIPVAAGDLVWDGASIPRPSVIQSAGSDGYVRRGRDLQSVSFAGPRARLARDAAALAGATDEPLDPWAGDLGRTSASCRELIDLALELAHYELHDVAVLHGEAYLDRLRDRIERALLNLLVDQVEARGERPPPLRARRRIVMCAMELVEESENLHMSVAELCLALGISARSLEYAFRDFCGLTPHQYIHLQRLRAARRALRESERSRGAVKAAAYGAGFRQLGRFSVQYRQFFGESPTDTLARR